MQTHKQNWMKVAFIVLVCLVLNMVLHTTIMPITTPSDLPPSILVRQDMVAPVAGIGMLITLLLYAVVFVSIQQKLTGTRAIKGLAYGVAFAVLWLIGFIEISIISDTTPVTEINNWLPDGITLVVLALGLGLFTAQDSPVNHWERTPGDIWTAIMIAVTCFIGRYAAYWLAGINRPYNPNSSEEFLWTMSLSIWMGVMYLLIGKGSAGKSPFARAWTYAGLIVGINWLLFQLFAVIFFDLSPFNLALRAIYDCVAIGTGMMISQTRWPVFPKPAKKSSM